MHIVSDIAVERLPRHESLQSEFVVVYIALLSHWYCVSTFPRYFVAITRHTLGFGGKITHGSRLPTQYIHTVTHLKHVVPFHLRLH